MYEKKRKSPPPTFEELLKRHQELTGGYERQHGRKLILPEDRKEAYDKLYKAVKSIESRNRRKDYDNRREQSFVEKYGFGNDDADINGITPKDRRRYLAKFKNCPIGAKVELAYMQMMTGLSLHQIWILQNETGLKPYPAVTEKAANKDQEVRDRNGIYI